MLTGVSEPALGTGALFSLDDLSKLVDGQLILLDNFRCYLALNQSKLKPKYPAVGDGGIALTLLAMGFLDFFDCL